MTKQMMVVCAIVLYVLFRSIFIEPNALEVKKYQIQDRTLAGVRVVFASDFHLNKKDYKKLDKIVSLINRQNPDITLLGGDFIKGHDKNKAMNLEILSSKLDLIISPVFLVAGEHDNWVWGNEFPETFKHHRIKFLSNSNLRTIIKGKYIDVIGLADLKTQEIDLVKAYYKTALPRLTITHNPDIYYDIMDDTSLIFAGHTHGSQFIFPMTPPLFTDSKFGAEFAFGLIKSTSNKMIITKGIGTKSFPFRFNCKPEIVVVDFI
ncbi:MAG: metallophosphoesterase [Candidatus Gastranaerophilales bacterium]|nr:metallophosphoesterase [Candidatus Gastranaerophilales bacterium]